MARALVLGNGSLHINLDEECRLRDVYYPSVGSEHHAGTPSRLGFWSEGSFAWFDGFARDVCYEESTLVSRAVGTHEALGLRVRLHDAVDFEADVFLREIELEDLSGHDREVRVFVHHDLNISGSDVGDTAFFDPAVGAVIHYKGSRYFLINGQVGTRPGVDMFTTGRAGFQGMAGTWADAEDGLLSGHTIEQGAVDSCIGLRVHLAAGGAAAAHGWMCVATAYREVVAQDRLVRQLTPAKMIDRTRQYWRHWVQPAETAVERLPPALRDLHVRSLLISRAHCDRAGGIVAATDRDILEHARDTYCYVWPRDGALVANALDRAGYPHPLQRFLHFCAERFSGGRGYLLHKYNPDGSLGSSWHPWYGNGRHELPIQEDETALVVWALGEYHRRTRDTEFVRALYHRVVETAGDFMASFRDWRTGLPQPSWDLWEERRGVHAFTIGAVHGGLRAAAEIAEEFGEAEKATLYRSAAAEVRAAADEFLWDPESRRFARQLITVAAETEDGPPVHRRDLTVDASLHGLFAFGMYEADDPRIVSTMEAVREQLWLRTGIGGVARYQRDYYQVVEISDEVPGNPWIICTLWLADWRSLVARSVAELDATVLPLLEWVADRASHAGLLPEQVHPFGGGSLSVSPLTWSHSSFVASVLTYSDARAALLARDDVQSDAGIARSA